MSRRPCVVVITKGLPGHRRRLVPIVHQLVLQGGAVHVLDAEDSRGQWESIGASWIDLFADGSLDQADPASTPRSFRQIAFAVRCGRQMAARIAPLRPSLIVHDQAAVTGWVVATELELPRVQLCSRSVLDGLDAYAPVMARGRSRIADECAAAAETLRAWGLADASPFSFLTLRSDVLNVYPEPPQFLTQDERASLEPVVFVGSLAASVDDAVPSRSTAPAIGGPMRVLGSFGTVIWALFQARGDRCVTRGRCCGGRCRCTHRLHHRWIRRLGRTVREPARRQLARPVAALADH